MITLSDSVLRECEMRARASTSRTEAIDMEIDYFGLLSIKYEIELCWAEKDLLDTNPLLRYLR